MLEIKDLDVKVKNEDKVILNKLSLNINKGEVHVIMGPNGTGKSTLSKVITGYYKYEVTGGDILFEGKSILDLTTDERARLGIFLAMQDPISIEGLSNSEFLKTAISETTGEKVGLFEFIKTLEKEMTQYKMQDEDVLSYALFPQVATEFFKYRDAQMKKIDATIADTENGSYPV